MHVDGFQSSRIKFHMQWRGNAYNVSFLLLLSHKCGFVSFGEMVRMVENLNLLFQGQWMQSLISDGSNGAIARGQEGP